jgi:tetratricopeptide (TPR) repeat protein/CheY-like chemotaxis protein
MIGAAIPVAVATPRAEAASIILVVAGDPHLRDTVARELELGGFCAVRVASAHDAVSQLAPGAVPVSLIIVDAVAPGAGGLTTALQVAGASPGVPLIVIMPDGSPRVEDTIPDRAVRFVRPSPFGVEGLVAVVHRMLTRAATVSVERSVGGSIGRGSTLPYAAFVEAAADGGDDDRQAIAGFLVLRHVDQWLQGTCRTDDLMAERQAVRHWIPGAPPDEEIGRGTAADLARRLLAILDAIDAAPSPELGYIAMGVFGLGQTLERLSQFALASDAYEVLLNGFLAQPAQPTAHVERAAAAATRLAYCRRRLLDWPGARAAYATADRLGAICGVEHFCLSARLGEAILISQLGDLEEADRQMAAVIAATGSERCLSVRAAAWHSRGALASERGRYVEAVEYLYEAWTLQRDDYDTCNALLGDLAVALQNVGHRQLARRAHQVLVRQPRATPFTRYIALINLLYIASLDRDELEFDALRVQLDRAPPTLWLKAEYLYHCGIGLAAFGHVTASREMLDRALAIADAHHLRDLSTRAAGARLEAPPLREEPPLPWGLRRVANALFALDVLVRSGDVAATGDHHPATLRTAAAPTSTFDHSADKSCL